MPPIKHSPLGASNAHQWMLCTPSIREGEKYATEEEKPSEAAEEGTLAHALAEDHLKKALAGKKITTPATVRRNPLYRPAMEEHVAVYVDAVMGTMTALQNEDPSIFLEQKLDLSRWIPEGIGTADCVIIANGVLHVYDLKYGRGVPVYAEENDQLKLYGLGAINEFECLYEIREAVLHIVQPRLDSITEWTVSREVLEKWGEFIVKPTAQKAFAGEGEFNPGEDQCRWCKARNRCRAYNQYILDSCQLRFTDLGEERLPNELSDKEIAAMLDMAGEIKAWCSKVVEYAQEQALNGVKFPGYKLVEGPSRRKITDEQKVIDILREQGYTTEQVCKLRGITDLEDLAGKKILGSLIGEYIVKPQGNPTLVPESDKRPEFTDIKFREVKDNE